MEGLRDVLPHKIFGYHYIKPLDYGPKLSVPYLATRLNCPTLTRGQVITKNILSLWNSYVFLYAKRSKFET